eukprot:CAMPEP_0176369490 /NCGR_PEP_ID=MMETSP0126-20121128/23323_1 /TAXON_ID=141414 ORGANISM="Strombidinopsis acuminatum, Strain SPMC142" /NCGR_SAMPLE_ID=MMETSP0126 /ASSEMBLY_ACC=CAM_ASM_000229 /LENGTH=90 /DNA_ID=CAMNT_0017728145 /DNA_START=14 /DNA_END=286 /DNA_ORIENTATION=-
MSVLEEKLKEQQKFIQFLTSQYEKDTGRKMTVPTTLGELLGDPSVLGVEKEQKDGEEMDQDGQGHQHATDEEFAQVATIKERMAKEAEKV